MASEPRIDVRDARLVGRLIDGQQVAGQVRTKLGRGPWSYWLDFRSSVEAIEHEVPTLYKDVIRAHLAEGGYMQIVPR